MRNTLVLWDVDGTLINAGGLSGAAMVDAFRRVLGCDPGPMPDMHGRTDRWMMTEVLRRNGIVEVDAHLEACRTAAEAAFAAVAAQLPAQGRMMPGAAEAMAALHAQSAVQSLLTGNLRVSAELKLRAFGLDRHVEFDLGGYGWTHVVRAELVAVARTAARARYGRSFDGRATVLIGDTPRDVEAALQTGASVVAVATGHYPVEELVESGAHAVLLDLRDTASVVSAVRSVVQS